MSASSSSVRKMPHEKSIPISKDEKKRNIRNNSTTMNQPQKTWRKAVCAFLILSCVPLYAERCRTLQSEQLHGAVRTLHAETRDETGLLLSQTDQHYDEKGRLRSEEESWLEMDGTEIVYRRAKTEYETDEDGWVVRTYSNYTAEGSLREAERWVSSETEYEKYTEGRTGRTRLYAPEGEAVTETVRYDKEGRTTDSTRVAPDGAESTMHAEYDGDGNETVRTERAPDGVVSRYVHHSDLERRTVVSDIYTGNATQPFMRTETKRDGRGNVTELKVVNLLLPDLAPSITQREYDGEGRMVSERTRTPDAPESVSRYSYTLDGRGNPTEMKSRQETGSEPPLVLVTKYTLTYY